MNIESYLAKRGYVCVDKTFRSKIEEWKDWYQGDVENFHHYNIYNGANFVRMRRRTLGMAKTVAEDWANLLLNEKTQISAGAFQSQLDEIMERNQWGEQSGKLIELSMALGTGAFVEYLSKDKTPAIDYIRADMIYPLSWDNGIVTECAFGSKKTIQQTEYIYLQMHLLHNGTYVIENHIFNDKTGEEIVLLDVEPEVHTNSTIPLFQVFTPNIVNNTDLDCPMGISVYANAVHVLQGIDLIYDSYCNEFDLGRKRIFIPMSMARIEDIGSNPEHRMFRPVFDTRDTVFNILPREADDGGKPLEINMSLRTAEHKEALQDNLNMLSLKCGMGTNRYSFESDGVKTATEVVSEKSDLYQSLKKHEHTLESALIGMVRALAYLAGASDPEVTIMFDDSVINDDNTKIDNNIKLVQAELKSKLSAIMDIYGMSKSEAQKELDQIAEESRGISGSDIDLYGMDTGNTNTDPQDVEDPLDDEESADDVE